MRKILFLIGIITCLVNYGYAASNYTVSKEIYVGSSITLDPKSDTSSSYVYGTGCNVSDSEAFHIERISQSNSLGFQNVNGSTTGYYNKFKLTALKAGIYTVKCTVSHYKSSSGYSSEYHYATYTITVKEVPVVQSITIPSSLELTIGEGYTFTPVIYEPGASTTLTWTSSNTSVVSISNGVVSTKSCGTAVITCTAQNGVSASCTVTVNPVLVRNITLNKTEMELEENASEKLMATISPSNATTPNIKWLSSNTSVAIVSQDGTITAISSGYANILATSTDGSDITASCLVHVVKPTVYAEGISISESSLDLSLGETYSLAVTISPNNVTSTEITWSSSNPSVATVDSKGKVTATGYGNAVVTAKTSDGTNLSAECTVTVAKTEVLSLHDVFGRAGSTITLPVALTNKQAISGFDFSIVLPEGVTFGEAATTDRTEGMVARQNLVDGVYKFSVMSMSGGSVAGNDGVVLTIPLQIGSALEKGEYPILIKDIVMFDVNGVDEYEGDDQTAILSLSDVLIGDVNGNGVVNTNDAIAIVNHVIGKPQASFIEAAADVNGNGVVNTNDAITIVNYVIGKTSTLGGK